MIPYGSEEDEAFTRYLSSPAVRRTVQRDWKRWPIAESVIVEWVESAKESGPTSPGA
jgi:hypothetical protein